jgi:DNA-binding NtrC family response regulator
MTGSPLKVLIVDDQPAVVEALEVLLDAHGIPTVTASSSSEALAAVRAETVGAVIQDMNLGPHETSGDEGRQLFRSLREVDPGLPILLITAWASLETAVELIKAGASDYIRKPWNDDKLVASIRNLVRMRRLELENARLRERVAASREALERTSDLCGVVYGSQAMHELVSLAINVAASDAPVLITGPSGAGKERLAEIVQANSRRWDQPFLRVNVGAIPAELLESELFGAEPGAYTGLASRRIGHFESAHTGTIFLDELDALPLAGQVKLLRVLQSGELRRLGSSRALHVDVRLISATNASLTDEIAAGRFREDLYYRLNVVELAIPALAERQEDILPLASHLLARHSSGSDQAGRRLSPEAEAALLDHSWPGNVRELENRIQRALVVSAGGSITAKDLGLEIEPPELRGPGVGLDECRTDERRRVLQVLERNAGVVVQAAAELGISRQALYRKMARLGVELERRPRRSDASSG